MYQVVALYAPPSHPTPRWYPLSNHSAVSAAFLMLTIPIFNVSESYSRLETDVSEWFSMPNISDPAAYYTDVEIYHIYLDCAKVSECQRFVLSTFRFVVVLVCRCSDLSTFWFVNVFLFVDVLVCRRFGLSTFWFADILVVNVSVCRRFD